MRRVDQKKEQSGDRRIWRALAATLALLSAPVPIHAQETVPSAYDRAWSHVRLYEGGDTDFVQSFDLSGRLQLDWAWVDNGTENHTEFNVRRFRFGFKTRFARDFVFHLEGDFDPQDSDNFYRRLTDAYLSWQFGESAVLTAGKQSAGFTLDGMTSSKRLITVERNNLTNNIWFTEEYMPGISVKGEAGKTAYFAGLFSSGDKDPEFGDFTGGEFVLLRAERDFTASPGSGQALWRLSLVHNEPDPNNGFTNKLENIASLNLQWRQNGPWRFSADLSAASGYYDQSDLWGIVLMPYYAFSERLELVGRYTLVQSADDNGVRFARYERELAEGLGDRYTEYHLGVNYYWYGHKLKLQSGIQYVDMRDRADDGGAYSGWSWTTGFRISW